MKTLLIVLGWTAGHIQERSTANLSVVDLYDIDARHFQGPIAVRYQVGDAVIDLPEAALASLSFIGGTLTSATVNPHQRPLDGAGAAKLCQTLEETFSHRGSAFVFPARNEFKEFAEGLKRGHVSARSSPPWRFPAKLASDAVNIVVRPFESLSSSSTSSDAKQYMIALEFGNSKIVDTANEKLDAARAKQFPNRRGRIPLTDYPK
jgi:hypothetical protein